ncbi:MAG: tetratricopeptide repeat protein [Candidatus Aquicultor sp.]
MTSAFAKPPKRLFDRWLVVKYVGLFLLIAAAIGAAYYGLGTRPHTAPTPQLKEESYKAYRNGDFRGAIARLNTYLKKNGNDQEARNVLITSYAQVGNLEAAFKETENLIKAKPNDAGTLYRAGQLSNQLGRSANAIAYFKRAATINPSAVQFHYQLAETYTHQKSYEHALAQWQIVLEDLPTEPTLRRLAYEKVGDIYNELDEPGKAKRAYSKAAGIKSDTPSLKKQSKARR